MFNQNLAEIVDELQFVKDDIDYYKNLKDLLGFSEENVAEIETMILAARVRQRDLTKRLAAIIL